VPGAAPCQGASVAANDRDSSMARYGEGATFIACLTLYQGGNSLNIRLTSAKAPGEFEADTIEATLARLGREEATTEAGPPPVDTWSV
jgi:hypothetical protein